MNIAAWVPSELNHGISPTLIMVLRLHVSVLHVSVSLLQSIDICTRHFVLPVMLLCFWFRAVWLDADISNGGCVIQAAHRCRWADKHRFHDDKFTGILLWGHVCAVSLQRLFSSMTQAAGHVTVQCSGISGRLFPEQRTQPSGVWQRTNVQARYRLQISVLGQDGCVRPSGAYHGLHRLPALGLGSRQKEILWISPEIHLQIDVEVHGVAWLRPNAYYSGRTRSVFTGQQGRFGLIWPVRSTVIYPTGGWGVCCVYISGPATPTLHHVSGTAATLPPDVAAQKHKSQSHKFVSLQEIRTTL